jgi:hypothetical protein
MNTNGLLSVIKENVILLRLYLNICLIIVSAYIYTP